MNGSNGCEQSPTAAGHEGHLAHRGLTMEMS